MPILRLIFPLLMVGFMPSCFNRFIHTDEEIKRYYYNKSYQPQFNHLSYHHYNIHYVEFGDTSAPLLMLIHGAPGAWYTWMNFADLDSLRKYYHIIIPDRLGYGKSHYGVAELNIHHQIFALQYIIEQYPEKELVLAGRSYGAPIAAALAGLNSKNCTRLVMYSPVASPYFEKKYWFSGAVKSAPIKWFLPKAINVASKEKYAHLRQMNEIIPYYQRICAPLIVVSGANDKIAHRSNYTICDSLFCVKPQFAMQFDKAGHFLTFEYPQTMASLLKYEQSTLNTQLLKNHIEMEKRAKKASKSNY